MVMELIRDLNQRDGVTVIQVTHNQDYAKIGHRVIELLDGRIDSDSEER